MGNSIKYNTTELFSELELERAETILKQVAPNRFDRNDYYALSLKGRHFGQEFDGAKIRKSRFYECSFSEVGFIGTDGISSVMRDCHLKDCKFKNAGFDFSDFTGTVFSQSKNDSQSSIESTSLSYSNFTNSTLSNLYCSGSNFKNAYFENARVLDCFFEHCNFGNATFKNVLFKNTDLSKVSLDYSNLSNVRFDNVKLPYIGILQSFYGIQCVDDSKGTVVLKFSDSHIEITFKEFIKQIRDIQAYFFNKKDFFILSNINIYLGNQEKAYNYLLSGTMQSFEVKDFRMIYNYCKLASLNHFFTKDQLRKLYDVLQSNRFLGTMTSHEYQIYLYEMDRIKRLLVDNPYGLPQIKISLTTNILPEESTVVAGLLKYVDKAMDTLAPQSSSYMTIRHNSPILLELYASDVVETLFSIFIYLSVGIMGITSMVERIQNTFLKAKQITGLGLDAQLKQRQIAMYDLELEQRRLQSITGQQHITTPLLFDNGPASPAYNSHTTDTTSIMTPLPDSNPVDRVMSISYTVRGDTILQEEFREGTQHRSDVAEKEQPIIAPHELPET